MALDERSRLPMKSRLLNIAPCSKPNRQQGQYLQTRTECLLHGKQVDVFVYLCFTHKETEAPGGEARPQVAHLVDGLAETWTFGSRARALGFEAVLPRETPSCSCTAGLHTPCRRRQRAQCPYWLGIALSPRGRCPLA